MMKKVALLAVAVLCVAGTAQAATWDSTTDGNWSAMIWDTTGDSAADSTGPTQPTNGDCLNDFATINHNIVVDSAPGGGEDGWGVGELDYQSGSLTIQSGGRFVAEAFAGNAFDTTTFSMTGGELRFNDKFSTATTHDWGKGTLRFSGGDVSNDPATDGIRQGSGNCNNVHWEFASGGRLEVDFDSLTDVDEISNGDTDTDDGNPLSTVTFESGSEINIDTLSAFTPTVGDTIEVLRWNEITDNGVTVLQDGSASLWQASVLDDAANAEDFSGSGTSNLDVLQLTYVPEPATMALLGFGGIGLLIRRRRRA
ncbi:MAG: PEP-CTERM sorting domain-containing protein [Phycisphaerae bacterium]|nr:PEP-CTERM sorting domain-containing protein [Phycisphaerae bacterium]